MIVARGSRTRGIGWPRPRYRGGGALAARPPRRPGARAPPRAGTRPRTGRRSGRDPSAPAAIATTRSAAARTPTTASHRSACRSDEEARRNRRTTETTTTIAAAAKASEMPRTTCRRPTTRPGSRRVGDRFALPRLRHARDSAQDRKGEQSRSRTAATAATAGDRRGTRTGTGRSPAIPSRPRATSSATGSRSRAPCDPLGGRPSWPHRRTSSPRARDRSRAGATRRRSAGAATRSDRRPPRSRPPPRGRARSRPGPTDRAVEREQHRRRDHQEQCQHGDRERDPPALSITSSLFPAASHPASRRRPMVTPPGSAVIRDIPAPERGLSSMCRLRPVATVGSSSE